VNDGSKNYVPDPTHVGKITCPRCGGKFLPVRGKLPMHTKAIEGMQRNGLYKEMQPVVCK
jgi:hypothetical protein